MIAVNCNLNHLRIITLLLVLFTISNSYPETRFLWFGNEKGSYQTARVYLKNGKVLSGFAKLDRIKNNKIRELTIGRTTESYLYNTQSDIAKLKRFTVINLEGRKIRPFETDSIIINSLTGISYDSLWLFKIIDGKISVFNIKPLQMSKKFTHIQKEGSEIYRYSKELLKEYLKDNEYALSLFTTYRDHRSKVLINYHPRRAILEYNFQTITKRKKVDELLTLLKKEKNIEQKIQYCKEAISIDSSLTEPYLVLGNYAVKKNNVDNAYTHYTNYLRYCNSAVKMRKVREKIISLQKIPLY